MIDQPARVFGLGLAVALVVLVLGGYDPFASFALFIRWTHELAAMIWGGLIVFMNFLHIRAIEGSSDVERAGFVKWYVDGIGRGFSLSARTVVVSGAVLLATSGYVLSKFVYGMPVFVPTGRAVLLWTGVVGGLVMTALVEAGVRPAFRTILDPAAAPAAKAAARARAKRLARINLFLLLPVTALMVTAAHV